MSQSHYTIVLADIDTLLALVYNLTTKLALAPSPPLLTDLTHHIQALAHASGLLNDRTHGAALVKAVHTHLAQIIDQLQTFLDTEARGDLIRTATIHDLIATARGPTGIPKDNRSAVLISWQSDAESINDNLQEIARLIDQAQSPPGEPPSDQDDGWDDFGLSSLDTHELARAKNAHSLLRLTTLLHKRVSLDLLPYPSSAPVSDFDSLLSLSNQLLSTSDDLVAAIYSPQELPCVREQVLQIANIVTSLQSQITSLLLAVDPLSHQLSTLTIGGATAQPTKKRADKKWFDTCVDHILRLCTTVSESTNLSI